MLLPYSASLYPTAADLVRAGELAMVDSIFGEVLLGRLIPYWRGTDRAERISPASNLGRNLVQCGGTQQLTTSSRQQKAMAVTF